MKTILIVDDELFMRRLLSRRFDAVAHASSRRIAATLLSRG